MPKLCGQYTDQTLIPVNPSFSWCIFIVRANKSDFVQDLVAITTPSIYFAFGMSGYAFNSKQTFKEKLKISVK